MFRPKANKSLKHQVYIFITATLYRNKKYIICIVIKDQISKVNAIQSLLQFAVNLQSTYFALSLPVMQLKQLASSPLGVTTGPALNRDRSTQNANTDTGSRRIKALCVGNTAPLTIAHARTTWTLYRVVMSNQAHFSTRICTETETGRYLMSGRWQESL